MSDPDKKPEIPTTGGSYVRERPGAPLEQVEATVTLDHPDHPENQPASETETRAGQRAQQTE